MLFRNIHVFVHLLFIQKQYFSGFSRSQAMLTAFLSLYIYEKYIKCVSADNICNILIKGILGCQVLLCQPGGTLRSIYSEIQKIVATNIYFINTIYEEQ